MAVCLFNAAYGVTTMHFNLHDMHWSGPAKVRDLSAHKDLPPIRIRSPQRFPGTASSW